MKRTWRRSASRAQPTYPRVTRRRLAKGLSREKGVSVPKFHSISLVAIIEPLEFIGELVDDRSE